MGNSQSEELQPLAHSDTISSEPPVLETLVKRRLLCCGCYEKQDETMPWTSQTQNYLNGRFRKYGWSRPILRTLNRHRDKISSVQEFYISDIRRLHDEKLNIQYDDRRFPKNFSKQPTHMTRRSEGHNLEKKVDLYMPSRANSLLDDQMRSLAPQQDFYQITMQIIENHLTEQSNPIKWFLQAYYQYFEEICPHRSINSGTSRILKQSDSHQILEDIKTFTYFLMLSMYSFYNLDLFIHDDLLGMFNMQNLTSFILTILFRNDLIYWRVLTRIQESNLDETHRFSHSLDVLINERPSYFGVPTHLELMYDTITELANNDVHHSQDRFTSYYLEKMGRHQTESNTQSMTDDGVPYLKAIIQLQKLQVVRSPVHQLKLIAQTTELIQWSINDFYTKNNLKLLNNFGADELVPILCYVIVQSQVRELGSYLKLIENFTPRETLNSSAGYKLVTLQTCFMVLSNWSYKRGSRNNQSYSLQPHMERAPTFYRHSAEIKSTEIV